MKKTLFLILTFFAQFSFAQKQTNVESTLETVDIETGKRYIIWRTKTHFEAPNWSRDGQFFIVNSDGMLWKIGLKAKFWA